MSTKDKINGHSQETGKPVPDLNFEEMKIPVPWGHISGEKLKLWEPNLIVPIGKWWGPKTKQPILALHGWQDNSGTFDTLAPLMRDRGFSLLCIDLPGHGFSSHLSPGQYYYLFWDGVLFVRRIVKYFNWPKITLMGHSLGGGISFLYASIYADEVDRYISIDISGPSVYHVDILRSIQADAIDTLFKYENLSPDKQPRYEYEDMVELLLSAHKGSLNRRSAEIMLRRGMVPDDEKPNHFKLTRDPRMKYSLHAACHKQQVLEYAARTRCKVLNIRAVPGYRFDQQHYNDVMECLAENANLTRVEVQGTHHVHLNEPEKVIEHICSFLEV